MGARIVTLIVKAEQNLLGPSAASARRQLKDRAERGAIHSGCPEKISVSVEDQIGLGPRCIGCSALEGVDYFLRPGTVGARRQFKHHAAAMRRAGAVSARGSHAIKIAFTIGRQAVPGLQ